MSNEAFFFFFWFLLLLGFQLQLLHVSPNSRSKEGNAIASVSVVHTAVYDYQE